MIIKEESLNGQPVTIIGNGPSWVNCEVSRTKEIWGCLDALVHDGLKDLPFTKLFAFDGFDQVVNGKPYRNNHLVKGLEIAKERGIPVVANQPWATVPYPTRDIVRKYNSAYFMPTVSYMIPYALYLDCGIIYLHGIDGGPQWYYQLGKPQIMFWIGVATGLKKEVRMGRGSLQWGFQAGIDKFPMAMLVDEIAAQCILDESIKL